MGTDERWPMRMHRQKVILHRASMRAYAERLRRHGADVGYISSPTENRRTDLLLEASLPDRLRELHVADPVDEILSRRLRRLCARRGWRLVVHDTPSFLTPPDFQEECFGNGRKPFMARFYQRQRSRMGLLVSPDGEPLGGQWSFDEENRKKLPPTQPVPPAPWLSGSRVAPQLIAGIERDFPESCGVQAPFRYPVSHEEASCWLEEFLERRLPQFGPYEDAISSRHAIIFHSVLTPALNIGLLTPDQIVRQTMLAAERRKIPLGSLEGFLRQIIGWREYMRAMYERHGSAMRLRNFWGFSRRMPRAFYDGTTGIAPVDAVIRRLLETGYCHHIERLMVVGNFMLLCRINPDDVYRWFMEMFVDSYDWVMVPNVYGMSQFADGGTFTTKPYLSGSNYLLKMSDYRRGDWCAVWDALFWTFISDFRGVFLSNPRLAMMARLVEKQGARLDEHRRIAERYISDLS